MATRTEVIIAVDPGKMTGWAIRGTDESMIAGELEWYGFLKWVEEYVKAAIRVGYDVTLVCESYTITPATIRKTRQHWSLEIIGCLRYWSLRHAGKELVLQSPASAKSFSTNEKLKALDWYVPGRGHANDALRHLLLYLVAENMIDLTSVIQ